MRTFCLLFLLFTNYQCLANIVLKNEVLLDNVLKNVFETCRKERNPGMQVVVVRGGQTLFKNAYGVKEKNKLEKMDLKTLVGVGTLTKSMANLLLLKLIQSHAPKKDITTPLQKFFNEQNLFALSYLRSKYATPADVMTHRMGFPNHNYLRLNSRFQRDTIETSFANMKATGRFRDSYAHNNVLFTIIIHMAERLGSGNWEKLAKDQLFTPIGMKNADFLTTFEPKKANVATPYVEHHGRMHAVDFKFLKMWEKLCSGCVLASANDMTKYMQFILKGGKVKFNGTTEQLIPRSDMNDFKKPWMRMLSPSVNEHFTKATGLPHSRMHFGYGLGLKTGEYRGHRVLEESGDSMGHSTIMTIFPDTRLGIYIALSGEDPDDYFRTTLSSYIADLYHQEEPWLNATSLCTFPRPFRLPEPEKPDKPIPENVELDRKPIEYVGDYYNKLYGFVRVKVGPKGNLVLRYGPVVFDLKQKKPNSLSFHMVGKGGAKHTITNARMMFKQAKFKLDPKSPLPPRVQKHINRPIDRLVVFKFDRTEFKRQNVPQQLKIPTGILDKPQKPVQKKPNIPKKPSNIKKPQTSKKPGMHLRPNIHKKPKPTMHKKPKPPMHKKQKPPMQKKQKPPMQKKPKPNIHKKANIPKKPQMPAHKKPEGPVKPKSRIGVPVPLG